jgi:hypothetical protein
VAGDLVFAIGCAMAALLYARTGVWCFMVPPLIAVITLVIAC